MAVTSFTVALFFFIFLTSITSSNASTTFNVVSYGAEGDGKTDSTKAFLAAWAKACASTNPSTMYVPRGRFHIGKVEFEGPCNNNKILVRIVGTLLAPSNYWTLGNSANWVIFRHVNGVTVLGGVLDGRGSGLWSCKAASGKNCPSGATSMSFTNSRNIVISGLTSVNSQMFHIVIYGCRNVMMRGIKVSAPGNSPNTDGIHVQLSSRVTILNSRIRTGDDCISIGAGTSNLWVEDIACGPGHGISIGSLGRGVKEPGVQYVTVKRALFVGTQNGLRIKSWGRPSSGFVNNVRFQHVVMSNVQNPILIDQHYCPNNLNCPNQASGIKISNVTYRNILGTSATPVAVKFDCSKKNPCSGIKLQDVKLTYKNQPAVASCSNANGTTSGFVQPLSCL